MRKIYWLFVFVLSFVVSGCGDDEDGVILPPVTPDTVAPQVKINSPHNDETYLAIGTIVINAWVKDDVGIKERSLFMVDPSGTKKPLEIVDYGREDDGTGEYIILSLTPEGTVSGVLTLILEAEDGGKNISVDSVRVNIIAEDLSELDFKTAFTSTGWFEYSDGNYDELNPDDFYYSFYLIVNKYQWDYYIDPAYVNEFGQDFGGHSQLWDKWDLNKNDYLEYSEFKKGLDDLKFFTDWDVNKDNLISENELADGVGKLWDVNKDNVVTAAEFETKLRKYFL